MRSIILQTSDSSHGPQKIKLLTNRPSLGFEDVEDQEEPAVAQVLEIPDDVINEGKHITLRFVRFQTVNSLHVSASFGHKFFVLHKDSRSSWLRIKGRRMKHALTP